MSQVNYIYFQADQVWLGPYNVKEQRQRSGQIRIPDSHVSLTLFAVVLQKRKLFCIFRGRFCRYWIVFTLSISIFYPAKPRPENVWLKTCMTMRLWWDWWRWIKKGVLCQFQRISKANVQFITSTFFFFLSLLLRNTHSGLMILVVAAKCRMSWGFFCQAFRNRSHQRCSPSAPVGAEDVSELKISTQNHFEWA